MEVKDICAGRNYTDKENNQKTKWVVCGTMFCHDDGKQSMKIDVMPVWKDWDGSFMVFDRKPKDATQVQQQQTDGEPF